MRTLVKSLRRLYDSGKITLIKLQSMLESGTITEEEYEYIVREET